MPASPPNGSNPPSAEDIRANDRERLIQALLQPVEVDDEDRNLAQRLLAERSPEDIAAQLVHAHRAAMPSAEELVDRSEGPAPRQDGPRPGFEDTIWFRMNVGRNQNADPRWLLPLLCRRGHITKNEIGAIRIAANETMFEVPRAAAQRFSSALARTASEEDDGLIVIPVEGKPRDEARQHRRQGPPREAPREQRSQLSPREGPSGPRPQGPSRDGPREQRRGPPPPRHKAKPFKARRGPPPK